MRTVKKNRQKMFYALYTHSTPVYELDDEGKPIIDYIDDDGNIYYRETGTEEPHYASPVEFRGEITSSLNELHAREYGVDQSSIYSEIMVEKNKLPKEFGFGTKIWRTSEIVWEDEENQIPLGSSADYTVNGIMTEFIDYDWYLLQRQNNE